VNIAQLEAALPQATVDAVATTPAGITVVGDVYVADERRPATADEEAWWRPAETRPHPVAQGQGSIEVYDLEISSKGGTRAEARAWHDQIFRFFHGSGNPTSVTGLISTFVESYTISAHQAEGPDVAYRARIAFVGGEQ